jgi:hypothetical protein
MSYVLFPGRHLLNTAYQARYLTGILQMPPQTLPFLDGASPAISEPVDQVIFAITSANQEHSRYNPIPFHVRAIGVDRFARNLELTLGIRYRIIGIPHYRPTPRFARYTLQEIAEQSEGNLELTPENCVVLCSTEALIAQYRELGFAILPAELGEAEPAPVPRTPMLLVQHFVSVGESWQYDPTLRAELAPATFDLWQDFPDIPQRVLRLWRDPLLNEAGSLTDDRDYGTYALGMSNQEIISVKYADIKETLLPGKIVDEGCADGALLTLVARDFPDSDLIGIEITGEFMARARERQRAGQFGGSFVHFHQRNILHEIFEPNAIDTTISNSTVHELWSYGDGERTVREYFARKFAQTRPGGRLVIRDVVGPADKAQEVVMWLDRRDGANETVFQEYSRQEELARYLRGLSTYARFLRFARDFRAESAGEAGVAYRELEIGGEPHILLALQDAVEFMGKKDYVDNWRSEMHERFAFWDFGEWKAALAEAGFRIVEDPNAPSRGSRVYTSSWIVGNRWQGRVALFRQSDGELEPLPFPPTNIVLVGEKPGRGGPEND